MQKVLIIKHQEIEFPDRAKKHFRDKTEYLDRIEQALLKLGRKDIIPEESDRILVNEHEFFIDHRWRTLSLNSDKEIFEYKVSYLENHRP